MDNKNENFEHCKQIADRIDEIVGGDLVKCPFCGDYHHRDDFEERENEDGETVFVTPCGEEMSEDDFDDLEEVSLYDYFNDCFDIQFLINSDKSYKAIKILVACGGPNIWIDTETQAVELYWWGDSEKCYLSSAAVSAIDEWGEEYYNCI